MINILDKCDALQKRSIKLKNSQQSVAEVEKLSKRLQEANEFLKLARTTYTKAVFLRKNDIDVDEIATKKVLVPLEKIINRFAENPDSSSLSKGKDWANFITSGKEYLETLETGITKAWKNFIDELYPGQSPDELNSILAKTEKNMNALQNFTVLYNQLRQFRNSFAEDSSEVADAKDLAEKLKQASKSFDYNVPDDVKAFLSAIAQGGAPLDFLTNGVVEWLQENKSETRYQIVSKQ